MISINIALKYISMWEKHFVSIVTPHVYIPHYWNDFDQYLSRVYSYSKRSIKY